MQSHRLVGFLLTALALVLLPGTALSQTVDSSARGAARSLGYEGIQAYEAGDIATAVDRLERAYQVLRVPSLALWSARALEKAGKWVEASERYLEATRLPIEDGSDRSVQEQAQADARAAEAALRPKVPLLVIEVRGVSSREVEVSRDGVAVNRALLGSGLPTNPGEVLVVGVTASKRVEMRVSALEGQSTPVLLDFGPSVPAAPPAEASPPVPPAAQAAPSAAVAPAPDAAPATGAPKGRTQRWIGWSLVGAGGGALVLGVVTAGIALGEKSRLDGAGCTDGVCPPGSDVSALNTARVLSTVGFIGGGVLAGVGVTLLLTAPKATHATVRARVGVATLELEGTF